MKANFKTAAAVAFAVIAGISFAPAASAQALQTQGFLEACNTNESFLANLADQEGGAEAALSSLCNCLVGQIGNVSQADLDFLAKDLAGSSTDEEKAAYATYEELSNTAGAALNSCLISEEIIPDPAAAGTQAPAAQ